MSWVKAVTLNGEDVFDEDADELHLQSKEWRSNMKKRIKDGYVDGIDAGQEASLQVGFNLGFREGAAQTVAVGRLKGIISAIWCWCQIQHPEKPVPACVTDLLRETTQYEDQIMDGIRQALENPPPSVSDVSDSMEELEVERDSGCARGGDEEGAGAHRQPGDLCRSGAALRLLVQRCASVAAELGLPQELMAHIHQLQGL